MGARSGARPRRSSGRDTTRATCRISPCRRRVRCTSDLQAAVDGAAFVVFAVPSHGLRSVAREAAPWIARDAVLISATKGLESESLARMSRVLAQETLDTVPVVVLSGPSFAVEVARGLPTAVLAASTDPIAAESVQQKFRGPGAPALCERRRGRRRDRRRAEERDRHCRRRRRRARASGTTRWRR